MEQQRLQGSSSMLSHHMKHILTKASELKQVYELQFFVVLSLCLQVLLILAGNVRKRNPSPFIGGSLWLAYLLADWVALYALGVIRNTREVPREASELQFFWVPFLLLHLGGPDTITAFSIEDNQLWLRHGLQMLFQVFLALYVYLDFVIDRNPSFMMWVSGVLVFIAGTLKYGERILALWYASLDGFRSSMVTAPDPGPNYARLMSEFSSKRDSGLKAEIIVHCEPHPPQNDSQDGDNRGDGSDMEKRLHQSYFFFKIFKRIFVDLILCSHDREKSQSFFKEKDSETVYQVIEMELCFVYDVIYTKAAVMFTVQGFVLRLLNICLLAVTVIPIYLMEKNYAPLSDKTVSYVLLFGAIVLELYALVRLIFSNWTTVLLQEYTESCSVDKWGQKRKLKRCLARKAVSVLSIIRAPIRKQLKWHFTVAQHNLIDYCLQDRLKIKTKVAKCLNLLDAVEKIELEFVRREKVTQNLWDFIHKELKRRCDSVDHDTTKFSSTIDLRGTWALKEIKVDDNCSDILRWWEENKAGFDESILIWHISTDICNNVSPPNSNGGGRGEFFEIANVLSNYLLYLLVIRRSMLASMAVIGQIRFGDTCAEAIRFLEQEPSMPDKQKACELLRDVSRGDESDEAHDIKAVKGDKSKSVLWNACKLAKKLNLLGEECKWKVLSEVWVEMLCYAAIHCKGIYHADRLRAGGEFLTFVWILMNHLGFGDLYQIETGHTRAKLVVYK